MEAQIIEQTESKKSSHTQPLPDGIWMKAAVAGGLWAAIEIILGSFLHNLRMPFAGSTLTFIGLALLISFHRMWPEKGLIWRAGLICALMKSISPSSVILGPMSGIFFEALMLEAGIRIAGGRWTGYFLGGILGMLSTLIHKVISLLILYGWNIVTIYKNIYYFLARQLRVEGADLWVLLWIVLGTYVLLGILSALMGMAVGKRSSAMPGPEANAEPGFREQASIPEADPAQRFRLRLLFLHVLSLPAGLVLINFAGIVISLIFFLLYLTFCVLYYRKSLRRLKKPVFWFQLFMITLLAALFWNGFKFGEGFLSYEGLRIGLEMNLRAVFIVVGFSSLSVELRNPVIRDFLFRRGFGKVYMALRLSFGALPEMIRNMPSPKQFFKSPLSWFARINRHADEWLQVFRKY